MGRHKLVIFDLDDENMDTGNEEIQNHKPFI